MIATVKQTVSPSAKRIAIIQGHPDPQHRHFCHALADAYVTGARDVGHEVEIVDVACLGFPLVRSREDLERRPAPDTILKAQGVLARADHVVLIYPIWNGGAPALLKGFLEQVFRASFIFPDATPGERLGFTSYFSQRKSLAGKSGRLVVTMQMPALVYRWYFHPHPERNTLRVGGINPVRETLIGQVEASDGRARERSLERVRALGRAGR